MNFLKGIGLQLVLHIQRFALEWKYGKEHVAQLDAMSRMMSSILSDQPRLGALLATIMGLTASNEEMWMRKESEFGPFVDSALDLAFRTTACHLSICITRVPIGSMDAESFSLNETADLMGRIWSANPAAANPKPASEIKALMLQASELLRQDPASSPPPTFKLGQLIAGENFMAATFAAMYLSEAIVNSYDDLTFNIHESN